MTAPVTDDPFGFLDTTEEDPFGFLDKTAVPKKEEPGFWKLLVQNAINAPQQLLAREAVWSKEGISPANYMIGPLSAMLKGLQALAPHEEELENKIKEADKIAGASSRGALQDFKNFFSPISSQFSDAQGQPTQQYPAQDAHWTDIITNLPKGLLSGLYSPVQALTGLDAENRVLNEIERKDKIKEGIATILTTAIGGIAGPATSTLGMIGEGAALGGVYSGVTSAGNADQWQQIGLGIATGGVGGLIGAGASKLFKRVPVETTNPELNAKAVQESADNIQAFRKLSEDIEQKSLADLSISVDEASTSFDAVNAAIKTSLKTDNEYPFIVQGTQKTTEELSDLASSYGMNVLTSKDGKHLFLPDDFEFPKNDTFARRLFQEKGFFPDQVVSYNGNRVTVKYDIGNLLKIEFENGKTAIVDPKWLRQTSDFTIVGYKGGKGTPLISVESPTEMLDNFEAFQKGLPATEKQVVLHEKEFTLPKSLAGSKPRYQQFTIQFNNDFDRAAYIVAGKGQSKSHTAFVSYLKQAGFDLNDVIAHGNKIRQNLKNQTKLLRGKDVYTGTLTPDVEFAKLPRSSAIVKEMPIKYSYEDTLDGFMKAKGLDPNLRGTIDAQLKQQMEIKTLAQLPLDERRALLMNKSLQHEAGIQTDVENLTSFTRSNNYQFTLDTGGGATIRDATGNVIQNFSSYKDLRDWVRQSGQAVGTQLDRSTPIPTTLGGGLLDNGIYPANNYQTTLDRVLAPVVRPFQAAGEAFNRLQRSQSWLANSYDYFTNTDVRWNGARTVERVYHPLTEGRRVADALTLRALQSDMEPLIQKARKLTPDQRIQIQEALETASIPELEARYQPTEIAAANQVAATGADIQNVFKFLQDRATILRDKRFTPEELEVKVQNSKAAYHFTPKEDQALKLLDHIYGMPPELIDIGRVRRLANLKLHPEASLSRIEYMDKYQFPKDMRESVQGLANVFEKYGTEFGFGEGDTIFNYMTHRRDLTRISDDVLGEVYRYNPKQINFYADLQRSGLLEDYEKDPFRAAIGYIKAGYKERILGPILDQIQQEQESILAHMDKGTQEKFLQNLNGFINDVRGHVPSGLSSEDKARSWITKFFSSVTGKDIQQTHWADELNKLITISAQAGLPGKGLRDFVQSAAKIYVSDGVARTRRVFELGTQKLAKELEANGKIESWTRFAFDSDMQRALDEFGNATNQTIRQKLYHVYEKAGDVGMKVSLQEYANRQIRAGLYAESLEWFSKAFKDVNINNGQSIINGLKKFGAENNFSPPARDIFLRYINDGQFEQAAHFYAKDRISQLMGNFGMGEMPRGWKTVQGRLAGKFGAWSIQQAGYLVRMASQGTPTQIATRMLRLGGVVGATAFTEHLFGVDMNPYGMIKGAVFRGGPAFESGRLLFTALSGSGYEQERAIEQLQRSGRLLIPFGFGAETVQSIMEDIEYGNPSDMTKRLLSLRPVEDQ